VTGEFEEAQSAIRKLKEDKKKLVMDLNNTKKRFEAQELVCWHSPLIYNVHDTVVYMYMYIYMWLVKIFGLDGSVH
jgi:hypothetical protein